MKNNTEHVIELLRTTADALERKESSWVDYDLNYSVEPYEATQTTIEIEVNNIDITELVNLE